MSVSVYIGTDVQENAPNFSNSNFRALMDVIGVPVGPELVGEFEGATLLEFREKIRYALITVWAIPESDGGGPATETTGRQGCRMIDCGMSSGYFQHRLAQLLAVVETAVYIGEPIRFC